MMVRVAARHNALVSCLNTSLQVMYTDKSLVVCAPTGSGKTVVFELAIIRQLVQQGQGSVSFPHKIIYGRLYHSVTSPAPLMNPCCTYNIHTCQPVRSDALDTWVHFP